MNISEPWVDPDDAPELGPDWFANATLKRGDEIIRRGRGRPAGSDKVHATIRLDKAVVEYFKAGGPGWQTRVNEALRKVAGLTRS